MITKYSWIVIMLVLSSGAFSQDYLSEEQDKELNRRASIKALENLFGDPDMIRKSNQMKEEVDKAQMEALMPPRFQNAPVIRVKRADDAKIHKIFVYPNQITTITITDSMGQPWPLSGKPIVASDAYSAVYDDKIPGLLTLETKSKFVPASMVLTLKGRLRPLQFQLYSDNETLDYAVDVKISGKSPLNNLVAKAPFDGLTIPEHNASGVSQFLDMPPEDARRLSTLGSQAVSVWKWRDQLVIRAPYQLLEPANPIDTQSRIDSSERVYLLHSKVDVAAFLNEETGAIVNVQVVGGM